MKNLGKCYEASWKYVTRNFEWILVHGIIEDKNFGSNYKIDHAWCKNGDKVYEPATDKIYSIEVFNAVFGAIEKVSYAFDDALKYGLDTGHYGPWHEIDSTELRLPPN